MISELLLPLLLIAWGTPAERNRAVITLPFIFVVFTATIAAVTWFIVYPISQGALVLVLGQSYHIFDIVTFFFSIFLSSVGVILIIVLVILLEIFMCK